MGKTFKDYAHLYLGGNVQVKYQGRIGNVFTYYHPAGKFNVDTIWVCSLEEEGNEEMSCSAPVNEVKPLLRPLSDISEEEYIELQQINGVPFEYIYGLEYFTEKDHYNFSQFDLFNENGFAFVFLLSKGFDLFGLIESGIAIDKTKV